MAEEKAKLLLNVFDGTRRPISSEVEILVTLFDGTQKQLHKNHHHGPSIPFNVPFFNNHGDKYSVIVFANGYQQAGFFPVHVKKDKETKIDLMLVPKDVSFNFDRAGWDELGNSHPKVRDLLAAGGGTSDEAKARYNQLMDDRPETLACFFNITTAMAQSSLPQGTPLDYLKELIWGEKTMKQDRFFAYADKALLTQVELAAADGRFSKELLAGAFHPGATVSYKQNEFGEGNLQLSFHTNEVKKIGEVQYMKVEADIDYYKNLAAHAILEVIKNDFAGPTDPVVAYVLRWIAGRHAEVPDFNPPYTIEPVAV